MACVPTTNTIMKTYSGGNCQAPVVYYHKVLCPRAGSPTPDSYHGSGSTPAVAWSSSQLSRAHQVYRRERSVHDSHTPVRCIPGHTGSYLLV